MRLGTVFVVIWMAVIAASIGAMASLAFSFGVLQSTTIGLATLALLGVYQYFGTRTVMRSAVPHRPADSLPGDPGLARQVGELTRRVEAMESRLDQGGGRARAGTDAIAVEVSELGALVRQLAETVSAQQATLTELVEHGALAERATADLPVEPFSRQSAALPAAAPAEAAGPGNASSNAAIRDAAVARRPDTATLASISSAVEAGRIELYLQPIVTLPQRKVRYYEALSRLRTERGELLPAGDFVADAEAAGRMATIDNLVAHRCVQVVRRLLLKNRDVGLFCNLSNSALGNPAFPQLLEYLDANRALATSLVLEFTQAAVGRMGPIEHESLAALAARGFRFSLDNVVDLQIEPSDLARRSFRFIKVPASILLDRGDARSGIRPADMSELVGRFGIDLIADRIEQEDAVIDLLDCDVRYGQGFLFSPPRPLRVEALQDLAAPEAGANNASGLGPLARGIGSRG